MVLYRLAITAAPILAPTLGGIVQDALDWRMLLVITLVIALEGFFCGLKAMRDALDVNWGRHAHPPVYSKCLWPERYDFRYCHNAGFPCHHSCQPHSREAV